MSSANNTNGPLQPFDVSYKFNASMAIIVVVLIATFFFLTLFVLYVRGCNLASVADLGWAYPPLTGPQQQQHQQQQQQQQQGPNPNRRGVAPEVLAKLPILRYASIKSTKKAKAGTECVVCLLAFEDAEEVRVLPACGHGFHTECIDMWLETHSTCPLCRRSINSDTDLQRTLSAAMNSLRREPAPGDPAAAGDTTLASRDPLPEDAEQRPAPEQPGQDVEQEAVSRTLSKNSESFRLAEHELELMEVREKLRARSRRVQSSRSMRFTIPTMPAHQEHESGSPSSGRASPALRRSASDGQSLSIWMGGSEQQQQQQQQRPSSTWSLNKSFRSFKSFKWLPNQRRETPPR